MNSVSFSENEQAVAAFLKATYGLDFNAEKMQKVEQFLTQLEPRTGAESTKQLLETLPSNNKLLQKLIAHITVPETYFFRFPEQFTYLEKKIDEMLLHYRTSSSRIRFWSAGCATGEEPYSLAIMLARKGLLNRAYILASDISEHSLLRARSAYYNKWSFRDQGQRLTAGYFQVRKNGFELKSEIRESVRFIFDNLADTNNKAYLHTFSDMDVILCRNVLIYISPDKVRKILRSLISCLAPDGFLITAPADPVPSDLPVHYLLVDKVGLVLQKPSSEVNLLEETGSTQSNGAVATIAEHSNERAHASRANVEQVSPKNPFSQESSLRDDSILHSAISELFSNGEYEKAILMIRKLLDKHSDDIQLRYNYATLLMTVKRYESAREAIRRVNYLNPNFPEVHFIMGTIKLRLHDYSGAKRSFLRARKIVERLPAQQQLLLASTTVASQLMNAIDHELFKLPTQIKENR